ncbi:proteasome maturation factor UMP1 [Dimargaris cristalligena]|uniref:Proteasome maturation factor UMP1 n=1 Tax=Dimargaris cristalligena TaxID=215637 RepID=A0A4P9ZX01_9FUNG|nr:proteasome maturation factor UMP1 [Dimargaris cristalligena]|eukprot:RKP38163.1 proteasome maturation factor UMP1 [Dimargaris cristalligena]
MSSALSIIPQGTTIPQASIAATATEYGTHDTLRHGLRTLQHEIVATHPLEAPLKDWHRTRDQLHLNLQRRMYGLHAPLRLTMERRIVANINRFQNPASLKHSNLGLDILTGRDETLDVEDFLGDVEYRKPTTDIHAALARQLNLS